MMSISERFKVMGRQLLAITLDAGFMVLWILIHWATDYIFERFHLSPMDKNILIFMRVALEATTFVFIICWTCLDALSIIVYAKARGRDLLNSLTHGAAEGSS